jgi:hypothetical protein
LDAAVVIFRVLAGYAEFHALFLSFPQPVLRGGSGREPNQAPVIHLFFVAQAVPVRLSTPVLGIIAARAVHL